MAELVDAIVADLSVKYEQYVTGFDKATAAHDRFTKSIPKVGALGGFTAQEAQQYADRHTKVGEAAEKAGNTRKRAAKGASDAEKAEAKAAADAVKRAAKEKEQAERAAARAAAAAVRAAEREKQAELKATQREQQKAAAEATRRAEAERAAAAVVAAAAEREAAARARLAAVAERAANRRANSISPATSSRIGATVPREGSGQRSIPLNVLNGDARVEAAVENEVNHLLADRAVLQSRLTTATGLERQAIRDRLGDLRLEQSLRRAGVDDEAIVLRLEERRTKLAADRAIAERKGANKGLRQFAEGAGVGRSFGSSATVAGIATAVGVGVGVEVIRSAVEYGKALDDLSKQLGITSSDLQAYEKIARDTGVETTTLSSAFGQFASNLGRAQQGGEEQAKVFKALGVNIKDFSSAGDALPTVIDRISQLKDPLQRAAIETRLFGEEGRKLDPLLSGGAARVSALAASLQETGRALSAKEIQELDDTARKLGEVKNALQVDLARVVAGNADAIVGLANSFGTLSGKILETIGRLQQFGAQQIRNGAISAFAGKDDKEAARQFLLSTPGGRKSLLAENSRAILSTRDRFRILPGDERLLAAQPAGSPRRTVADVKRAGFEQALAPLKQERVAIRAADTSAAPAPTPPVQTGAVNPGLIRTLGAPKPPKGPKGKSAEQLEREAEQRTRQFNDQIAQATADYLRAQQQLTGSTEKRAAVELELLDTAYKARVADIDSQEKRNVLAGADAKLEATRSAELKAAEKKARDAQASAIEQDKRFDLERALTASTQSLLDARATILSSELSMAQSSGERRRLQLALVDNQAEQERVRLNGVIKSTPADSEANKQAQADLARLPGQTDAARRAATFSTRGVLEQYRDELPRTAGQINDALESVKVRGLQSLDDAITGSISKVFKLGGAFGDVANGIISDLIRIGVQRAIIGPLADSLFGSAGGGGGGGIGKIVSSIGSAIRGGRASGGNIVAGVPYDIGENGPETVVFGSSGRVYPNGALPPIAAGGGGSTVIHQHFQLNASGAIGFREFVDGIQGYVDGKAQEAGSSAYRNAVRDAPVRSAQQRPLKN